MDDPTRRFSSRVENYVKYRPRYPRALLATLQVRCNLNPESVIADVGSGTGFLTELFLENGNLVYGVEPNAAMRAAGEQYLARFDRFRSVGATAEATTLPDDSIDLVVAGQAFHWFDREGARDEFARILRPGGWVALIWNTRLLEGSPFLEGYERLLRDYGTDYEAVVHTQPALNEFDAFFDEGSHQVAYFPNEQRFDFEGVKGRMLSSSYTPQPGHPNHEPLLATLRRLFDQTAEEGRVSFQYETELHWGRVTGGE